MTFVSGRRLPALFSISAFQGTIRICVERNGCRLVPCFYRQIYPGGQGVITFDPYVAKGDTSLSDFPWSFI
jgi:hypothetical protein